jgi:hypothetical protein
MHHEIGASKTLSNREVTELLRLIDEHAMLRDGPEKARWLLINSARFEELSRRAGASSCVTSCVTACPVFSRCSRCLRPRNLMILLNY